MISFIVIGKNEGWKLNRCFKSIKHTINYNNLLEYEIIYIDSASSDNSIQIAKYYKIDRIIQLTSDYNPAIARNIGVEKSKGNILFFIDGDMEIVPKFLSTVYNEQSGLVNSFISGKFINYYYNSTNHLISKKISNNTTSDKYEFVVGGLFLISKKYWLLVKGMQNIFKYSQDIDLGLRLSKENIFLLRKKEIAAIHHTISYKHNSRMWKDLIRGKMLYTKSLLYRKNLKNKYMYKRLLRNDYTLIILMISLLVFFLIKNLMLFYLYLIVILLRAIIGEKKLNIIHILNMSFYFLMRDFSTLIGFFLFWPRSTYNITYQEFT